MKRRWIKFKGKAPKFNDPAEATFSVLTKRGSIFKNCSWYSDFSIAFGQYETFYTYTGSPIPKNSIRNYKRE